MKLYFFNDQSGVSLLETLVGIAILGVVAAGWAKLNFNQARTQRVSEQRVEGMALSREIIDSVDCGKTFPSGAPVPASGPIALLNSAGSPVIPVAGKQYGDWFIRAYLQSNGQKNVQVYKLKPRPGFANALNFTDKPNPEEYFEDPLKRSLNWQHAHAKVFAQGMSPCTSRINGGLNPIDELTLKVQILEKKVAEIGGACPEGSFVSAISDSGIQCTESTSTSTTIVNETTNNNNSTGIIRIMRGTGIRK